MATAEQQAQSFERELNARGLKYDRVDFDRPFYKVNFGGGDFSFSHLCINIVFDSDGESAQFVTGAVVSVPTEKTAQTLLAVNKNNCNFRWVKFYLDKDNDVICEADAILDANGGGKECVEVVMRMASIVDDAYGDYMRAIWG